MKFSHFIMFLQFLCSTKFEYTDVKFLSAVRDYDTILQELFKGYALDFMPWLRPFNR